MTSSAITSAPKLLHDPLGTEHPYQQDAVERKPRYPVPDQPVIVGIRCTPGTDHVTLRWSLNGVEQPSIEAECIDQDVALWQAILPAQPAGSQITYLLDSSTAQLGPFTYRIAGWQAQPGAQIAWQELRPDVWEGRIVDGTSDSASVEVPLSALYIERLEGDSAATRRLRITFDCPPGEAFYGFGERFNGLDQRGEQLDVRCYEEYKNQGKRTYIPMPFFVSSRRYGLLVETSRYVVYDLAATDAHRWSLDVEVGAEGDPKLVLFTAPDLFEITGLFSTYIGKPSMMPNWAFGPWMSGNEWNTQARVIEEVEQTLKYHIPATVLVIEAWSDETTFYIWNDAEYTPRPGDEAFRYSDFTFRPDGKWPNPKAMIDYLHEQNIRLVLWQVPAFKKLDNAHPQHQADEAHVIEQGYMVREADGSPYRIRPFWFRGGMVWDVTNPEAREWWLGKRAYLLDDLRIDGFKTDGGEHLWGYDLRFADGRASAEVWNEYPLLYVKAYHEFARARRGEALTFSRAGFTGAQRYPAHWAGDEDSTWEAFRHSIFAGLSAGVSGIPFWGWDIGGFSGEIPSAELYLRATAMAAFCPIMQYHAEYNSHQLPRRDRTPWNIQDRTGDEAVIRTYRFYANLRLNLMPYLITEARHCVETGQPMMRALALAYPDDLTCADFPYQYLFGRDLLVTPVVEEGATEYPVYLPDGTWYDLWTGARLRGQQVVQPQTPIHVIPVYVKEGAHIPLFVPETKQLGDSMGNTIRDTPNRLFCAEGAVARYEAA
jgi:alpha-glucosidase (family GH31 glycosyl hydrolase)